MLGFLHLLVVLLVLPFMNLCMFNPNPKYWLVFTAHSLISLFLWGLPLWPCFVQWTVTVAFVHMSDSYSVSHVMRQRSR